MYLKRGVYHVLNYSHAPYCPVLPSCYPFLFPDSHPSVFLLCAGGFMCVCACVHTRMWVSVLSSEKAYDICLPGASLFPVLSICPKTPVLYLPRVTERIVWVHHEQWLSRECSVLARRVSVDPSKDLCFFFSSIFSICQMKWSVQARLPLQCAGTVGHDLTLGCPTQEHG